MHDSTATPGSAHFQRPSWFTANVFNRLLAMLTRLGISVWGSRILRIRGRNSGQWRSTPINLLMYQGHRYLVSPRGETQWVRNLRVAKSGELVLGRHVEAFRATEVQDNDKVPLLRDYLKRWKFEVGVFFSGIAATSSDSELLRIASDHPVFRIDG